MYKENLIVFRVRVRRDSVTGSDLFVSHEEIG
jgi:hypothetical protein